MLDRALVAAGHRSVVLACEGSEVCGTLLQTEFPTGEWTDAVLKRVQAAYRLRIAEAIRQFAPNVVHLHGIDFLNYLPESGLPTVATLHLPPSWYPPAIFSVRRPDTWIHCVSSAQRSACPAAENLLPTIENGVPDAAPSRGVARRNFAAQLGRICPEKGTDTALRVASAAGLPLLIAGEVYPYEAHLRFFEERVKPLLSRTGARFIGAVGPRAKRRLLCSARCVLIPSSVAETSSLVAMEAAMCGTPVVAFAMGALTEIVEQGRTGFLVRTEAEMVEAIQKTHEINPAACRAIALERFPESRAQAAYLRMYEGLAP